MIRTKILNHTLPMEKPAISAQRGERKLPPPPKVSPWLVFPHGKDKGKFHTFYDISDDPMKKSVNKFIPELSRKRFWQKPSHQGWVIIVNRCWDEDPNFSSGDCFLWNPVSLETIMLPSLDPFIEPEKPYYVRDCVLSSPPQTGNVGKECESMVFFLIGGGGCNILIYCRTGDKEWRKHDLVDESLRPRSMFYLNGKLFVMGMCGMVLEMAIVGETVEISESIDTRNSLRSLIRSVSVAGRLDYDRQSVVMESFGEVFRIDRFYIPRGTYKFLTHIVIAKLDISSRKWEEVKSLDDTVFFLSKDGQLSCLASDLGLPKGCVYFTQAGEISLYKYDMDDKSVLHCSPCPDLPTPWSSPQWLMISATPRVDNVRGTKNHVLGKEAEKVTGAAVTRTSVDEDTDKEDVGEARPSFIDDEDMVMLISDRLHTVDYIHLRAVSKKYRSMLNLRRSSSTRTVRMTGLSPWLVFVKYDQPVYNFVSPMHNNENYLVNIPELLKGSTIRFSKDGWLLMSKDETLFFYNPFSKSIVRLPDLPNGYNFSGISFSSLPTSSDCIVFGINHFILTEVEIACIKRGENWTNRRYDNIYLPPTKNNLDFKPTFNNPVFYRGAFYCLDLNGTLGVFQLENDTSWEILAMVPQPNCEFIYKSFLVECGGNLLCVLLGRLGKWVRIFRLNNDEMVWVEVKHLGRHMLCISHTSSIAAVAPTKQMENKIYFPRLHEDGILCYSPDTGLYHCLGCNHSAKDYGNSKEYLICSWIEPNCSETASGPYLDWLNI